MKFQSTRPLRGGTSPQDGHTPFLLISIHPPLAGRDRPRPFPPWRGTISIHPPLAGRDEQKQQPPAGRPDFNPPAPCGAGHQSSGIQTATQVISIHPPLAGRD